MSKIHNELPQLVFTARETAAILKISHKSVYRLCDKNVLHATKALRHLRITRKSLEAFLSSTSGEGAVNE